MLLRDFAGPLRDALHRMLDPDVQRLKRFVLVEDTVTGRFVQFAPDPKAPSRVLLDVPCEQIDTRRGDGPRARALALLGPPANIPGLDVPYVHQVHGLTVRRACELAAAVFVEVHGLPADAELVVIERTIFAPS